MNRNLLNCVMTALLLVVMNYRFTENAIHEGIGVVLSALFWLHNFWNWRSYQTMGKKQAGLRRHLAGGVLFSQTLFASLNLRAEVAVYELH